MATILRTDGTKEQLDGAGPNGTLTLDQMQAAVGGWVQIVFSAVHGQPFMVVNEEGKLEGLPQNPIATAILWSEGLKPDWVAGNAILISTGEVE